MGVSRRPSDPQAERVEVIRRAHLDAVGYAEHELRGMVRRGELVRLRRGAFLPGPAPPGPEGHRLLTLATVADLTGGAVVSHVSAAVLHGLPVWGTPLDVVHATRNRGRSGGRCEERVHVHSAPLEADEIVEVDGVPVTSVARTLLDLARTRPFEAAVVSADAALHAHRVDRPALDVALARRARWPGLPAARRALAFARPGAVNPGESRSRVAIARAGLPEPVLQWEVRTAMGRFVGEVDFGWPVVGTVGEFDGRQKYGRLVAPGRDPGDVVYAEKLREDALRATGLAVVRWGWVDLDDFAPVAARLRAALRA